MKMYNVFFILLILISASCSSYKLKNNANPLDTYSIESVYIPMFYSKANISNLHLEFTQAFYRMFSRFPGIRITDNKDEADAVLLGILSSRDRLNDSIASTSSRAAKNIASDNIGSSRNDFIVSSTTEVRINLKVILIKKPTQQEIKLIKSSLITQDVVSPKIIFNESYSFSKSFTNAYYDGLAGQVVGTQNRGAVRQTIKNMADSASDNVRDMLLYAF